jgi:carbonic anhydrase
MNRLIEGYHRFRKDLTEADLEEYRQLSEGQSPEFLFITCSDSRVVPSIFTKTEAGLLFEIRTAGNLVPAYGSEAGCGLAATIEYAVSVLGISHAVICGHTRCGAMGALFEKDKLTDMPDVEEWLNHAERARRVALQRTEGGDPKVPTPELVQAAVEANVVAQLDNLRTHPCIATGLDSKALEVHGWVYGLENAQVQVYDPISGSFDVMGSEEQS